MKNCYITTTERNEHQHRWKVVMTESEALRHIRSGGFFPLHTRRIPEGANHFVFDVTMDDGAQLIARFDSGRQQRKDSLFGGLLSRQREQANMLVIRSVGLPAPAVLYSSEEYMLVEKMPGILWNEYLVENKHTVESYLKSLVHLGKSIAKLQTSTQKLSFGDAEGQMIKGRERQAFNDRIADIFNHRLQTSGNLFNTHETHLIKDFLSRNLCVQNDEKVKAVLVMTDMHPMNFLVGENGQPTGFFDLEACQYAHPALEMYGIRLFLFNYYSNVPKAADAFYKGYHGAGGSYNPKLDENIALESTLGIMRLLELTCSYNGVKDGIRDSWSDRFKQLLFESIEDNQMKWSRAAGILSEKTRQPNKATL